MKQLPFFSWVTFKKSILSGLLIGFILFGFGYRYHLKLKLIQNQKEKNINLDVLSQINQNKKNINSSWLKNKSQEMDKTFYQTVIPMKEEQIDDLEIYNVYLGENTSMKEVLGWLGYYYPLKTFKSDFSYAFYNKDDENLVHFKNRIKEPPPKNFLLAYFEGGTRAGKDDYFTLADLKHMGGGATHLYFFWSTHAPLTPQEKNQEQFLAQNYHLEIFYDKGTNFGGPSYLFIDKIAIRDLRNNKIVGIYPMNIKIEEPFNIFNYDFDLKFPFYNYKPEGLLWSTHHIKSLRKIELFEKRTGQKRTLYYDAS